jgi:hypothetical protein
MALETFWTTIKMGRRFRFQVHGLKEGLCGAFRKSTEAALLEETHLTAMARLREEQTDYLSNLGGIATELER